MLVDTHCHLYFKLFEEDIDSVLERAWENGVSRIMIPGIDLETSRQAVALCDRDPRLFAAVGVHPNDSLQWNDSTLAELRQLAQHPHVLAIGEIGLDYYRDHAPRDHQQVIFRAQLELAAEVSLPVIIHNRDARQDLWKFLNDWQAEIEYNLPDLAHRPGVLHSFDGTIAEVAETTDRHFFVGISGPVTFKNAAARQEIVRAVPLDRLLLETDAPFLAPQAFRGRRNEPGYVRFIAEKVSEITQLPLAVLETTTSDNAAQLFRWDNSIE